MNALGLLQLSWRPYRFLLPRSLITSRGTLVERSGWLLRLTGPGGSQAWGEAAAPLLGSHEDLAAVLDALPTALEPAALDTLLPQLPAPLACALGMALAELAGLGCSGWRAAPAAAGLLPAGADALSALELQGNDVSTFKWKVAAGDDATERLLLEQLLRRLPATARLRLDANGGWDRSTARWWADRLVHEPRLEWLEQPLAPEDHAGLEALAALVPVALDESCPLLSAQQRATWPGWLVRRPVQEGDPRPLLRDLQAGTPRLMLSTAFETGIGHRFVQHLAALQADGPTPTAPGFAPGWRPCGALFEADPQRVWEAVA